MVPETSPKSVRHPAGQNLLQMQDGNMRPRHTYTQEPPPPPPPPPPDSCKREYLNSASLKCSPFSRQVMRSEGWEKRHILSLNPLEIYLPLSDKAAHLMVAMVTLLINVILPHKDNTQACMCVCYVRTGHSISGVTDWCIAFHSCG